MYDDTGDVVKEDIMQPRAQKTPDVNMQAKYPDKILRLSVSK